MKLVTLIILTLIIIIIIIFIAFSLVIFDCDLGATVRCTEMNMQRAVYKLLITLKNRGSYSP